MENGSMKGNGQLLIGKDGAEVLWICTDIVTTSPFKIDIPMSSKSVRFGT